MKLLTFHRLALYSVVFAGTAAATVIPQSQCTFNNVGGTGPNGGFTCDLYPSNPDGTLNDDVTVSLPDGYNPGIDPLTPGYLVILDPGLDPTNQSVDMNQANWLQVVEFLPVTPPPYYVTSIMLLTKGCNDAANPNDTSCFPTYSAVTAVGNYFDVEPTSSPAYSTPYDYYLGDVKQHEYFVYYFPESTNATAPEPASIATFGAGALALALLGRRRFARKHAVIAIDLS
jgi:hypothetical protein